MAAVLLAQACRDPEAPSAADLPILNAEERVDLATMIEAYTINGAYLIRREQVSGSVEVGKRADLIVLDRNLFEIPAAEINDMVVELTLFDGEVVHQSDQKPQ